MGTSPVLTKWIKWLDVIKAEVQQELVLPKHTFSEIQGIIKANPKLQQQNYFYRYLARTYISHMLMGVRRQTKIGKDSISFARLLQEMIDNSQIISREYYVGLYKDTEAQVAKSFADNDFNKFADPGFSHIKPSLICDDLTKLRSVAKRCEKYADKRIAHWDKSPPKEIPTYNELDDVVELLDKLYAKYAQLFHGSSAQSLLGTFQYDWKSIFYIPWISNVKTGEAMATDVQFNSSMIHVRLLDGRVISAPLEWYSKLRDATDEQRANWQIIGEGVGIHWEDIDEDISVASILNG
ncbi:MAG: DUF2442 domain-containing protein [Nitrospinae bacterium]|nr:DUF2442 domain-containing protein [Nitrospinota bacterium]